MQRFIKHVQMWMVQYSYTGTLCGIISAWIISAVSFSCQHTEQVPLSDAESNALIAFELGRAERSQFDQKVYLFRYTDGVASVFDSIRVEGYSTSTILDVSIQDTGVYSLGFRSDRTAKFIVGPGDSIQVSINLSAGFSNLSTEIHGSRNNDLLMTGLDAQIGKILELRNVNTSGSAILRDSAFDAFTRTEMIWKRYNTWHDSILISNANTYYANVILPFFKVPVRPLKDQYANFSDYLELHYFDQVPLGDPRILSTPYLAEALMDYLNGYCPHIPERRVEVLLEVLQRNRMHADVHVFVANYLIDHFILTGDKYTAKALYAATSDDCTDEILDQIEFSAEMYQGLPIGDVLPGFNTEDSSAFCCLADLMSGHEYLYLYFWRSGCPHCEALAMELVPSYEGLLSFGVEVAGLSIDQDSSIYNAAIDKMELPWPTRWIPETDQQNALLEYRVTKTPYTLLLDREGRLIKKDIGPDELYAFLINDL